MTAPSPEVRAILKEFCNIQRAKYGPDWKAILAAEMAAKSRPVLERLLTALYPGSTPEGSGQAGKTGNTGKEKPVITDW